MYSPAVALDAVHGAYTELENLKGLTFSMRQRVQDFVSMCQSLMSLDPEPHLVPAQTNPNLKELGKAGLFAIEEYLDDHLDPGIVHGLYFDSIGHLMGQIENAQSLGIAPDNEQHYQWCYREAMALRQRIARHINLSFTKPRLDQRVDSAFTQVWDHRAVSNYTEFPPWLSMLPRLYSCFPCGSRSRI